MGIRRTAKVSARKLRFKDSAGLRCCITVRRIEAASVHRSNVGGGGWLLPRSSFCFCDEIDEHSVQAGFAASIKSGKSSVLLGKTEGNSGGGFSRSNCSMSGLYVLDPSLAVFNAARHIFEEEI
jgi:hypothetical protein